MGLVPPRRLKGDGSTENAPPGVRGVSVLARTVLREGGSVGAATSLMDGARWFAVSYLRRVATRVSLVERLRAGTQFPCPRLAFTSSIRYRSFGGDVGRRPCVAFPPHYIGTNYAATHCS